MPELPEVETVRRTLLEPIVGQTVIGVDVFYAKMIRPLDAATFSKKLIGQTIHAIDRLGKYLIFKLEDVNLLVHLRMEGKFFIKPSDALPETHEHIAFYFASGVSLRYHDVRKFGTMTLRFEASLYDTPPLSRLGLEVTHPDVNAGWLHKRLNTRRAIKVALLDQTILLGLGNIYVDETLFCAKINPNTQANTLTLSQCETLINCAKRILDKAIALGGTSIRTYLNSLGISGKFQNELTVHLRQGEPCLNCQTSLVKTKVGGRGTYYCPTCQPFNTEGVSTMSTIIGLTGGIATGKSTVSAMFKDMGIPVIDTDAIAHDALSPNAETYRILIDTLGEAILAPDKTINRNTLGKMLFNDPVVRKQVNEIIHPYVRQVVDTELTRLKALNHPFIVVDVPLLFETNFHTLCDVTVFVYAKQYQQIERMMARDHIDEAYAKQKLKAQLPLSKKRTLADFVIDNSQSIIQTKKAFQKLMASLRKEDEDGH